MFYLIPSHAYRSLIQCFPSFPGLQYKPSQIKYNMLTALLPLLFSLLLGRTSALPACHMLCSCSVSTCISCHLDFPSTAATAAPLSGSCACPPTFANVDKQCLYCPANCYQCSTASTCTQCYGGYRLVAGQCVIAKYWQGSTPIGYEVDEDPKQGPNAEPSGQGFYFYQLNSTATLSKIWLTCAGLASTKYAVYTAAGASGGFALVRAYTGLPYHQWLHVEVRYLLLDSWNDDWLAFGLYSGSSYGNRTYDNSDRNQDLCGAANMDSVDSFHKFISHTGLTYPLEISLPVNLKLGISKMRISLGTCPRECLSCSSPTNCLMCKPYYLNSNGTCTCDPTLSHSVSFGCLPKCTRPYLFIPALQRCVLCSLYLSDCHTCQNTTTCIYCNQHSFWSAGLCTKYCPVGTYYSIVDTTATIGIKTYSCQVCPSDCSACYSASVCLSCVTGKILHYGSCVAGCPPGTTNTSDRCVVTSPLCSLGCETCTGATCNSCYSGYWLSSNQCAQTCPINTFPSASKQCLTCGAGCAVCVNANTCQQCQGALIVRDGLCVSATASCAPGLYYDARVRDCVACLQGCTLCLRDLCYNCTTGYYLDNGKCVQVCSDQKYYIVNGDNSDNLCLWRNPLCQSINPAGQCTKCRSMPFTLALQSGVCRTTCYASNKTYNPELAIIADQSRLCDVTCPANCQTCYNGVICLKCYSGYVIGSSGSCTTNCLANQVSDSYQCLTATIACPSSCLRCDIIGNCFQWSAGSPTFTTVGCPSQCARCINSTTCVECQSGTYFAQTACSATCQDMYFKDEASKRCRPCRPQCQTCTSFSACSSCKLPLYLDSDLCVRECPAGKFPSHTQADMKVCQPCAANCRTCFGPASFQCLTCFAGFKKDHTECVSECPVSRYADFFGQCDWCHQSCKFCFGPAEFQCLQCNNNNKLYRGQCFDQCPAATYLAVTATRQCYDCSWGCAICTSKSACQQCFGGYSLSNGTCLKTCTGPTYLNTTTGACLPCAITNCQSCSPTTCFRCNSNFSLLNNSCSSVCPSGTYKQDLLSQSQCLACPIQCATCTSAFNCLSCASGYNLLNNMCLIQCEMFKYYDTGFKMCRFCSANCVSCTSWGCTECEANYLLNNGACVRSCPNGTYQASAFSCSPCPSACINCSSLYQCTVCAAGFTLRNGLCMRNQTCEASCATCLSSTICLMCRANQYRLVNGTSISCVAACPNGYYPYTEMQCFMCPASCTKCSNVQTCTQCKSGLILFNSRCITVCEPGWYLLATGVCQRCALNCRTCVGVSTNCTSCASSTAVFQNLTCVQINDCPASTFYSPVTGYCTLCLQNCQICSSSSSCQVCAPGYSKINNLCTSTCPSNTYPTTTPIPACLPCLYPCLTCVTATMCTSCLAGYPLNAATSECQLSCARGYYHNLVANRCQKCNSQCLECVDAADTCKKCSVGYYLIGTECVLRCPEGTFASDGLRACLPCSDYCQLCNSQASCQKCQFRSYLLSGICFTDCPEGYYPREDRCQVCTSPCRECTGGSSYECNSCLKGTYLFNGRCLTVCPSGYFKHQESMTCRPCAPNCKTCTSFTECQSCVTAYANLATTLQCQPTPQCPSTLPRCHICNSVGSCILCYQNFFLEGNLCTDNCSLGTYADTLTGRCSPCDPNCDQCAGPQKCTTCTTGYAMYNRVCYVSCPLGTIEQTPGECVVNPCAYVMGGDCALCVQPYLKSAGQCVKECPSGTYPTELQCKVCRANCQTCLGYDQCTTCLTGYKLTSGACLQQCPSGSYPFNSTNSPTNMTALYQTNQCVPCINNCLTCSSGLACLKCSAGYYLNTTNQCVLFCNTSTYANPMTGICEPCQRNCRSCSSLTACTLCGNGTVLVDGYCVTVCPYGYYREVSRCVQCPAGCQSCNSGSQCRECSLGYVQDLVSGLCVRRCPAATYPNGLQCAACSEDCLVCSSFRDCHQCVPYAYLHNGKCINACPVGFTSNLNRVCIPCDPACRECSILRDNCTACMNGFVLVSGFCTNTCPANTFLNATSQCQSCNTSGLNFRCAQCYGPAIDDCLQCMEPFYLNNRVCVQSCPIGTYPFTGNTTGAKNRQCLLCNATCLTCVGSANACTSCPLGYFLINGRCLVQCPKQTYPDVTAQNCPACIVPCLQCLSPSLCTRCPDTHHLTPWGTCVPNCLTLPPTLGHGYYSNQLTKQCQACADNCLTCSNTSCTVCTAEYYLHAGQCVKTCPIGTYTNGNACTPCSTPQCVACASASQCVRCMPPWVLHQSGCVMGCPSGYVPIDGRCFSNQTNQSCPGGYYSLLTTTPSSSLLQCLEYCPRGYYPAANSSCTACPSSCLTCTAPSACLQCAQDYKLVSTQCVKICPVGTTPVSDSVCLPCQVGNCVNCVNSVIKCEQCEANYYLLNGQCLSVCPDGYYRDATNKACMKCLSRCKTCTSQRDSCTSCFNPSYPTPSCTDPSLCLAGEFNQPGCTSCPSPCATCVWGSVTKCLYCQSPYVTTTQGSCASECPTGHTITTIGSAQLCIQCGKPGCKYCAYPSLTCQLCEDDYILHNGACLATCSELDTSTSTYTGDGSICVLCSSNCLQCIITDASAGTTTCQKCEPSHRLRQGQCVLNCPAGSYPLLRSCLSCLNDCAQCSDATTCLACPAGKYLHNGRCVIACPVYYYNASAPNRCLPCTDTRCVRCSASACTLCQTPYILDSNTNQCTKCMAGWLYESVSRACIPCDVTCAECEASVLQCIRCASNRLLLAGRCYDRCPSGYYGYVDINGTVRQCRPCGTNCTACIEQVNSTSTSCTKCNMGYLLNIKTRQCVNACLTYQYQTVNYQCQACPSRCLTCTSSDSCTTCVANSQLLLNMCVEQCPTNMYITVVNGQDTCASCPTGCTRCVSGTNCTQCRADYYLNAQQLCREKPFCPLGQYPDMNGACQNCSTNCSECTSQLNCTKCIASKYLSHGQCLDACLDNQYLLNSTGYNICVDCPEKCSTCVNASNCSTCIMDYFLSLTRSCVLDCGLKAYKNMVNATCESCEDVNCKNCTIDGCLECLPSYYLFGYISYNRSNGTCTNPCPPGFFPNGTKTPPMCDDCTISNCYTCNLTTCSNCTLPYALHNNTCMLACPIGRYARIVDGINICVQCMTNCRQCNSEPWCVWCRTGYFLHTVEVGVEWVNGTAVVVSGVTYCTRVCPDTYFGYDDLLSTNNDTCRLCESWCKHCLNQTHCTECVSDLYVLDRYDCIPFRCLNCTTCVDQKCQLCDSGFFLHQLDHRCYQKCPNEYYGNNDTMKCDQCMQHCYICPNKTKCDTCNTGYNFTGFVCVEEAFMLYGSLSNMSGFTSNITEITSAVYLATSVGPLVFGEMTTTYFNIEFCQFILFHASASGGNSEMQSFLDSLQRMSLTVPGQTQQKRRLLVSSLADPMVFLVTNAPIFGMMGGFLLVYLLIFLLQKYTHTTCLTCPNLKFYVTQICAYLRERFTWIYFDFVAWISYLPFVYFSIMQLKQFSFNNALQGFSCVLAIIIIAVYPLYPVFILYQIRKNYNQLVHGTNKMVEMSLQPYVYKVKRPHHEIPTEGQRCLKYITTSNMRLAYVPLKYFRKFLFALVVALAPSPVTALIVLITLNVLFIGYMGGFRPKQMPYMVIDFVIEAVLLFFEIFMLVYLVHDGDKISVMSIVTHAVGFITANLSLIVAIILNLIAYYKIFMCLYELVQHLKEKMQEKQKFGLKDEEGMSRPNNSDENDIDHNLHEKDNLTKSMAKPRINDDITEYEPGNDSFMRDKEIYGDSLRHSSTKNSKGGLPALRQPKKKVSVKQQLEETDNPFIDKQLKQERNVDNDEITESQPNSGIISSMLVKKNKEMYGDADVNLRSSIKDEIPKLKASVKITRNVTQQAKTLELPQSINENESMYNGSQASAEEFIPLAFQKQLNAEKFKRRSVEDDEIMIGDATPVITNANKFKRIEDMLEQETAVVVDREKKTYGREQKQKQSSALGNLNTAVVKDKNSGNKLLEKQEEEEEGEVRLVARRKQVAYTVKGFDEGQVRQQALQSERQPETAIANQKNKRNKKAVVVKQEQSEPYEVLTRQVHREPVEKKEAQFDDFTQEKPVQQAKVQKRKKKREPIIKTEPQQENQFITGTPIETNAKKFKRRGSSQNEDVQIANTRVNVPQRQPASRGEAADDQDKDKQVQEVKTKSRKHRKVKINDEPTLQNQQESSSPNKTGLVSSYLEGDLQNQQYLAIKKRNKDNMFGMSKQAQANKMTLLDDQQFQESNYGERPRNKTQLAHNLRTGGMEIAQSHQFDNRDHNASVGQKRSAAAQRMRRLQNSAMEISEKSDYSDADSVGSTKSKRERREKRKREKSGILQMHKREDHADLDHTQL